ncbi:hypothetical protein [Bacteroides sp. 51]|uniref:hypothetical protein n=1 Tax=Bacteroides sp. 51 TaxID=2302938 RepID=UPI0013D26918|nr:hypothetical protein [Bacteroides sp. 51]NDV83606.1 hypothetical protein [Bacteroides sp. 51]
MEKYNKKTSYGIILIAVGVVLKYLPDHLPIGPVEFLRGLTMGIGITLLIIGYIEHRKNKDNHSRR